MHFIEILKWHIAPYDWAKFYLKSPINTPPFKEKKEDNLTAGNVLQ